MAVPPPPTFEEFGDNIFSAPPRKPTLEQRGAVADVGKKEVETEKIERTLPTTVQTNQAPEGYMWVDPNDPSKGVTAIPGFKKTDKSGSVAERKATIKAALKALQRVRELAEERLAIGSASEFLQNVPLINQNRRNIEAAIKNAESGIISDMVAKLAEANQGGVSGMANTLEEARRLGAQVADLSPSQDLPSLMEQAKLAEEYYLRQAASLEGKEAVDQDIATMYLPEARLLELAATDPGAKQLSADGTETIDIPDWYQQSHLRYLIDNKDDLDPSQYAAFRATLDERAGLTPNIDAYLGFANDAREFFKQGGAPQQLGVVPPATQDVSALRQGITEFAQNPVGAGLLSGVTSATAGIPLALAGGQEKMEAVRQNQPVASFIGDVIGQTATTALLGPASRIAGVTNPFLRSPVTQDAIFSTISGATQAEDPLEGATAGLISSLGGEYLGRAVGRALPDTFAPGAMREARESVPSSSDLGQEADALYRQAQAQGQKIAPNDVDTFIDDTEALLRSNGFMDQDGNLLGTGPVQDAYKLLRSFRGKEITPMEAKTIREKFAEGRMAMRDGAPDNTARMFSGELTKTFDDFAEATNALPGIAAAREVAQRRILGRDLERTRELGQARGDINYSQGGEDLGIRRAFGNLDTAEIRGSKMYPPEVEEAIRVVSRGTPVRNVAQTLGRLSPQGGTGFGTGAGLGVLGGFLVDPVTGGLITGSLYGAGAAGRKLASDLTRREAELAELIARGGPSFQNMLNTAAEEAAIRGGRIGSSIGATAGITPLRDVDLIGGVPDALIEDLEAKYTAQEPAKPKAEPIDLGGFKPQYEETEPTGEAVQTTRIIDNRVTDIDPVTGQRIFLDTGEPVEGFKRGGAVKGYKGGGLLDYLPDAEDVKGFGRSVAEGALYGYNDDLEALLRAGLDKKARQSVLDDIRREQTKYEQEHGGYAALGNILGGVGTAFVPGMQGLSAARVARMGPKARAAYELALGTAQGGLYGTGKMYDDPDSKRDPLAVLVSETASGTLGYPASRGVAAVGRRARDFVVPRVRRSVRR